MKCYQKMVGPDAANLYIDGSKAVLAMMNVKTGQERRIAKWTNVSERQALKLAEGRFGKFEQVTASDARRTAGRSFRSARRKFSMEERIKLIDEDIDDDQDLWGVQ